MHALRTVRWAALVLVGVLGAFAVHGPSTEAAPPGPGPLCNQVNLHPGNLQNGQVGFAYSDLLWLTPANAALPVTVTGVTGTLPPGLAFAAGPNVNQVTLLGTPTLAGTYTFTVELGGTYVLGTICKDSATYTVVVAP